MRDVEEQVMSHGNEAFAMEVRGPFNDLHVVERRGATGEFGAGLFEAIAVLASPMQEVTQRRQGINEPECMQSAQDFGGIE